MDGRMKLALGGVLLTVALLASACTTTQEGAKEPATVEVTLREMTITPADITAPAGRPITLKIQNAGQAQHAFALEAAGRMFETPALDAGQTATLELPALEAGTYSAWCTVAGHREAGMAALLQVGQPASAGAIAGHEMGPGLTAEQMAEGHRQGVQAFPAPTAGQGNQLLEPTMDADVKVFDLRAQQVQWEVSPGTLQPAFAYNGQVPGPQIRVRRGDRVRFVLENELPEPTTLHFHGVTVPNEMDGVPYVTQDPVMPGTYFVYEFSMVDQPGTYMYHSHFNSTEQVRRGLFGALIVEPRKPAWDVEHTLFLSDGPLGFALNGKGFPATAPLAATKGDRVLIRLANAGQQLHPMHLHGYHFEVVARDGFRLDDPYMADTLVIAPGERYDVLVNARFPGAWAFHCHILSHAEDAQGMFGMVTALVVE